MYLETAADTGREPYQRVTFLTARRFVFADQSLIGSLSSFILSVLERLRIICPDDVRAVELGNTWRTAFDDSNPAYLARRLAAQLGVLWDDASPHEIEQIATLASRELNPIVQASLDAVSLPNVRELERETRSIWAAALTADVAPAMLTEARAAVQEALGEDTEPFKPWHRGWSAASAYRRALGLADDQPIRDITTYWHDLDTAVLPPALDSVIAWSAHRQPVRTLRYRATGGPARRFADARDTYGVLFRSGQAPGAVVQSRFIVGSSSIANAFAAELLAPVEQLRRALGQDAVVWESKVDEIAATMDAPAMCVLHQIENHGLAVIIR